MTTASDLMTTDVLSVSAEASVADVAHLLLQHRVSALPVVDAEKHLLGMVSEGDLLRSAETDYQAHRSRWLVLLTSPMAGSGSVAQNVGRTVAEVMNRDVIMASEGETLARLIDLLSTSRIKRLPIVRSKKLVGIVSRVDVLKFLAGSISRSGKLVA